VQDEAEIGGGEAADDGAAIDDAADLLEPRRELDVIDRRVDRRKRAEHLIGPHARRERGVALRIEGLGLGHAAGHPQHDDRIGAGLVGGGLPAGGGLRRAQARLGARQRRQGGGGRRAHEAATAHAAVDGAFVRCEIVQFVHGGHLFRVRDSVPSPGSGTPASS
jgi:hypothetical protein